MNKTEKIIAAVATMAFGVLLIVLQGKFIGLLMTVAGICLIVWGVLDFLHHLMSKNYQKRTVGLVENGSWAPSAAKTMKGLLEQMKNITVLENAVTIRGALKESDLPALEALADAILK